MNPVAGNDVQSNNGPVAGPVVAERAAGSYADRLIVIRDTFIVFSMQMVFRATMFLRHLNY